MLLIDDLLLLPAKGIVGILKKVAEAAEEEYTDEGRVKEELMMFQTQFELDQITEEEYTKREKELMKRLHEIQKYKEGL
jgi:hypothetical protein